ncbi:MAG: calcium-binding protein [Geminicoccaceae bacterium]
MAVIGGTTGNDTRTGTDGNDTITTGSGRDTLYGAAGLDTLYGGTGNDSLFGGGDRDWLYAGDGNDTASGDTEADRLFGGNGNDWLWGGAGDDSLDGGEGGDTLGGGDDDDTLWGGGGNDTLLGAAGAGLLYGGSGRDTLTGGADEDSLYGGTANDVLSGGEGAGTLDGGAGSDTLTGGNAADTLWGGTGNDVYVLTTGNDVYADSDGIDTLRAGVSVTLGLIFENLEFTGTAALDGTGNGLANRLTGNGATNRLYGLDGDDILQGGGGNDSLFGGNGDDTAVLGGSIGGYVINRVGSLITIIDTDSTDGLDGRDRLSGIERLEFTDRAVTLRPLDLDVLVGNINEENQLLVNQGGDQNGTEGQILLDATAPGGDLSAQVVALGDLDGDGDLDVVIGRFNQPSQVLVNQGGEQNGNEGDFLLGATVPGGNLFTTALALGDVDGDGDLDALIGNDGQANRLLINRGGSEIAFEVEIVPGEARRTQAVALGDVDGDGDLDAVTGNINQENELLVNQGGLQGGREGEFAAGVALAGGRQFTVAVALGDLDGDGDLDALIGNDSLGNRILLNEGGAQAGTPGDFVLGDLLPGGTPSTFAVALGDLDGDGDLDALLGNLGGENQLLVNQGGLQGGTEGDFLLGATVPGGSQNTQAVALGDLDGDGDLDALVSNDLQANQLLINQGGLQGGTEGSFGNEADVVILPGGSQRSWDVALGDLDGDGTGGLTPSGLPWLGSKLPIAADIDWSA